jgi:predicted nucleic acid-binding protein
MGIFLDTCFFYAIISKKDPNHKRAHFLLDELETKKYGKIYSSDYIVDEALTLASIRSNGNPVVLEQMGKLFFGEEQIAKILPIHSEWLEEIYALQFQMTNSDNKISFTDCSSIVCCKKQRISSIISFDGHFSGHLTQIT